MASNYFVALILITSATAARISSNSFALQRHTRKARHYCNHDVKVQLFGETVIVTANRLAKAGDKGVHIFTKTLNQASVAEWKYSLVCTTGVPSLVKEGGLKYERRSFSYLSTRNSCLHKWESFKIEEPDLKKGLEGKVIPADSCVSFQLHTSDEEPFCDWDVQVELESVMKVLGAGQLSGAGSQGIPVVKKVEGKCEWTYSIICASGRPVLRKSAMSNSDSSCDSETRSFSWSSVRQTCLHGMSQFVPSKSNVFDVIDTVNNVTAEACMIFTLLVPNSEEGTALRWHCNWNVHLQYGDKEAVLPADSLAAAGEDGTPVVAKTSKDCTWIYSIRCYHDGMFLLKQPALGVDKERCKADKRSFGLKSFRRTCLNAGDALEPVGEDPLGIGSFRKQFSGESCVNFYATRKERTIPKQSPLPGSIQSLLCTGQLWVSLFLSVHWTPKIAPDIGNKTWATQVDIPFPYSASVMVNFHAAFGRRGDNAVASVWREQVHDNVELVYIGFASATQGQLYSILTNGPRQSSFQWDDGDTTITLGHYIGECAKELWEHKELGSALLQLAAEDKKQKFIFSGISHGAALAQVLSLRFELARLHALSSAKCVQDGCNGLKSVESHVLAWNSYHTMASDGTGLVQSIFEDRAAHFIASEVESDGSVETDAVPGYFREYMSDYPNTFLLDQEGILRETGTKYPINSPAWFLPQNFMRVVKLHQNWHVMPRVEKEMAKCR